jgi:hypothetical protein
MKITDANNDNTNIVTKSNIERNTFLEHFYYESSKLQYQHKVPKIFLD